MSKRVSPYMRFVVLALCFAFVVPLCVSAFAGVDENDVLDPETIEKIRSGEIEQQATRFVTRCLGSDMLLLAEFLGKKLDVIHNADMSGNPPHLVLLIDNSTSFMKLLKLFDESVPILYENAPKGTKISVVALRAKPEIIATNCEDHKSARTAIRKCFVLTKDSQTRAKLKMNPAQQLMARPWDPYIFLTEDDCVKDWCEGVRWCLKELYKDYPFNAIMVMTLDNADTENDVENVVAELRKKKVTFFAAAPETLLVTSDPQTTGMRRQFYDKCKELVKIDYGPNFIFHRRESAVPEVRWVPGLNGPHENVGNNTGWGFYGLSRCGFATGGSYYAIQDPNDPMCACYFHQPGERLSQRVGAHERLVKPLPVPGFKGKIPEFRPIVPAEMDDEQQKKYEPLLYSRQEVFAKYSSSPYYQYLFQIIQRDGNPAWDNNGGYNPGGATAAAATTYDNSGRAWFRAWHIDPYGEEDDSQADEEEKKIRSLVYTEGKMLGPLRIYASVPPPHPWGYNQQPPGNYGVFKNEKDIKAVRDWLKGAIPWLDSEIARIKAGVPKTKPEKWEHRAKAEIDFFILCLENNRFYIDQYYHALDELLKDNKSKETFASTAARKPYMETRMLLCLKQRCEEFHEAMGNRPPMYGADLGKPGFDRYVAAYTDYTMHHPTTTWANFFQRGWQRQYYWIVRIPPRPGRGGPGRPPRKKPIPRPPIYQRPGGPEGPAY